MAELKAVSSRGRYPSLAVAGCGLRRITAGLTAEGLVRANRRLAPLFCRRPTAGWLRVVSDGGSQSSSTVGVDFATTQTPVTLSSRVPSRPVLAHPSTPPSRTALTEASGETGQLAWKPGRAEGEAAQRGYGSEGFEEAEAEGEEGGGASDVWLRIRHEARAAAECEPFLASYLYSAVLAHPSLERALGFILANKLASPTLLSTHLKGLFTDTLLQDPTIQASVRADLLAVRARDPACPSLACALLNFKGFLACQTYRVAHRLWTSGREALALALSSRVSEVFHMEIHPAAKIGSGVLFDHATGVVIGETAEIGNNVSILHQVTLGGTGTWGGVRHPRVCDGVLIGAGAKLLGPITVGAGARIGAASVVLRSVPPHATVVGNPGQLRVPTPGKLPPSENPSETMEHAAFEDYII